MIDSFNSSVVRLVVQTVGDVIIPKTSFNSSVVRLVVLGTTGIAAINVFQFQCGAIGS